jgi:hypothetical protein
LELSPFVQRRNDISFLFYEKATKNLERDFTLLSAVGSAGWFFFYESHHMKLYICFNSTVNWWQVLISAESHGVAQRCDYNMEFCSQFDDRGIGVQFSTGMEFFSSTQLSYRMWNTRGLQLNDTGQLSFLGKAAGAWGWPITLV